MKARLEWIDSLKGFAILLVVMGHVIPWSIYEFESISKTNPDSVLIWHIIYSFHMPLFMFVSGFLFGLSHYSSFKDFLIKIVIIKGKKLLVPYFITGILIFYWRGGQILVYWYLLTLFQLLFVVGSANYFIDKIHHKTYRVIIEITFIILMQFTFNLFTKVIDGPILYVCYNWFPHLRNMFVYFALGCFVMRHLDITKYLDEKAYSICLLLFILSFIFPTVPYKVCFINFRSLFAIYCCIFLFKRCFNDGHIIRRLKLYGKYTMHIYILHLFFGIQIYQLGEFVISMSLSSRMGFVTAFVLELTYSLIVSLIIIELCLYLGRLIKTSKYFSFAILGE